GRDMSCDSEAIFRDKASFQKLQFRLAPESGEDYARNPDFPSQFPLESLSIQGNKAISDTLHVLIERSPYLQQLGLEISNGDRALMELIARSDSIEVESLLNLLCGGSNRFPNPTQKHSQAFDAYSIVGYESYEEPFPPRSIMSKSWQCSIQRVQD
ncbi:hypothetical protein HDU81_010987, partial [Chytriomyces hyalinus]